MRIQIPGCLLRSWQVDDAPALALAANNRKIWLNLRDLMPHPYALADAEAYLGRVTSDPAHHSFCLEIEGKAAGAIGLKMRDDVYRQTAELGYWLAEPYWGRGLMTEIVRAFVAEYFEATPPLRRIFAEVFANNPASARVLEKAGFQFEGRMRRNVIKDGQILDSLLYARVREESPLPAAK